MENVYVVTLCLRVMAENESDAVGDFLEQIRENGLKPCEVSVELESE